MGTVKNKTEETAGFAAKPGEDMPLGISRQGGYVQFTAAMPGKTSCTLLLYQAGEEAPVAEFLMPQASKGIFSLAVKFPKNEKNQNKSYEYLYRADDMPVCDSYALQIAGRSSFGEEPDYVRACVCIPEKRKEGHRKHALEALVLYKLHVRGYTMSATSGVKHKGTYLGLVEKLPYLKKLGINAVLLLPVTEFDELAEEHRFRNKKIFGMPEHRYAGQKEGAVTGSAAEKKRVNYWGYQTADTFYFAPKASYAAVPEHVCEEFAAMAAAFHAAGIDVYLEMMFHESCTQSQMLDVLRYWVRTYGIDGFHINDSELPLSLAAGDAYLQDTFFLASTVTEKLKNDYPGRLAEYRESFCMDMRRYLKGDENLVPALYHYFKNCRMDAGSVYYITDHNGFTLRDLYSYDVRHNEANGESGRDGTEYNFSWNCGEEGFTKKQKVEALRLKMMKNALTVLFLSRGIPMLLAGDEFARTKSGNNNSYCQDNEISWLDWSLLKKNKELSEYVRLLIALRKEHPMFWQERELRETDFLSCGYPEISLHGVAPWQIDTSGYNRLAGILFCGTYVRRQDRTFEPHFYLMFNMHWEPHTFELPMKEETRWQVLFDTAEKKGARKKKPTEQREMDAETEPAEEIGKTYRLQPRSIVVLCGTKKVSAGKPQKQKTTQRKEDHGFAENTGIKSVYGKAVKE